MPAREPATAEELRAELDRVRRESLRAEAERARAEELQARLQTRDQEIEQVRQHSRELLEAAERQLNAASMKLAALSEQQTAPQTVRELDDARVRAARLQAELTETRAERDEMKR